MSKYLYLVILSSRQKVSYLSLCLSHHFFIINNEIYFNITGNGIPDMAAAARIFSSAF